MPTFLAALATLALAAVDPPAAPPSGEEPEPEVTPSRTPARPASLLGGASLGEGGAAFSAVAGYPKLAIAYGQGFTVRDDWGALLDVDWAATEVVAAGAWRREILRSNGVHLALRLQLGFYACAGGTWIWADNRPDVGVQLTTGLAFSVDAGPGLFTVAGDLPATWTFDRGMGWILAPIGTLAYEAPVTEDFSVGARMGVGVRGAGGGAPGANASRTLAELLFVATWRLF